ncbi:hydroxyacylglutathione hydrolase [Glaciecola sp. 2405UD65-10]|uniref:hydroxyacylglutathione hydrolase n=1 Tax=Glaciecola sp. 2405UD65-10 TaxID=3397244 RepID=UPI003B59C61C
MNQITKEPSAFSIYPIPAFDDNYIWCIHNSTHAIVVDPGDAKPVIDFLQQNTLQLQAVLITHHHFDHVGGITELLGKYPNIHVYGPNNPRIKGLTHYVKEHDKISFNSPEISLSVLETPGHTLDHISYFNEALVFCGDTLFSGGCGRMFEGTPDIFYPSLKKLGQLPEHTKVYCTHEYTQANLAFASHVDPNNKTLKEYANWVTNKRANKETTLPSTISKENEINPFLRCHIPYMQNAMQIAGAQSNNELAIATFASLRKLKDEF